jgi:SAM-dependent methyltransferase
VTRDQDRFIPALRFNRLTGLFDPVSKLTTREGAFKRRVLERASLREGERVLDLACGTGTLALAAARSVPGLRVVGVDSDPAILERLVIGDVGRPQDRLMRAAVLLTVQMLDGFDVTSGNVAGRLPVTLREAGLGDVRVTDRLRTPIGTLEIVTARR